MRCSETREPSLMAHNLQTKVYALLRDAFKDSRVSSSILSARVSDANMQSHRRDYIHEMGYEPKSTTTVTTPLDPNIVYSQEDCPAEVDVDLRAQVWTERQNHPPRGLVQTRPGACGERPGKICS